MPTIYTSKFSILAPPPLPTPKLLFAASPSISIKFPPCPNFPSSVSRTKKTLFHSKSSEEEASVTEAAEDEWMQKLPDKKKALYSHSLPCVEAWLKNLGFHQSRDDRAVWYVEKPDWHAQLSLDVTDLYIRLLERRFVMRKSMFHYIRYLKNGPGNLEKDVERRFSYALSREDIENAILGGP
ncbi:hypothetical protein BUALT_Bualt06G0097900 [Buddleja alternifolia]|uniref:Uncharacterized protein n=1 Tax=Buddleja alternifolia TaxID=168488 RepID=A0AAV6XFD0_9LAMI|nr:hypothetical protein BUALT_Bualt06G0097900 [Buddleja alternifolia]